jgi:TDG/mug DNA glycosylase family protein
MSDGSRTKDARIESLPPREPPAGQARILILGSMPGVASLKAQQYYAHPRNRFWPVMEALFGVPFSLAYEHRVAALNAAGVALWDVLQACERPGSLDSRIVRGTEVPNDIGGLLDRQPALRVIALNGGAAREAFRRSVAPELGARLEAVRVLGLPSTSPANAGMGLAVMRVAWGAVLDSAPDHG